MGWWDALPKDEMKEYVEVCRHVSEDIGWDCGVSELEWECYKRIKQKNPSLTLEQATRQGTAMAHKMIMARLDKQYPRV